METTETRIWKDILDLFHHEELVRFRHRAKKAGKMLLENLFDNEIKKRGH